MNLIACVIPCITICRIIKIFNAVEDALPFIIRHEETMVQLKTGLVGLKAFLSLNPDVIKDRNSKK